MPIACWNERIDYAVLADGALDRLLEDTSRVELRGSREPTRNSKIFLMYSHLKPFPYEGREERRKNRSPGRRPQKEEPMSNPINWLRAGIVAAGLCLGTQLMMAQDVTGDWQGTRSERNAITGGTFTVNFEFEFAPNGAFRETARLGSAVILRLTGQYSLMQGGKPGDPTVTHILLLAPQSFEVKPGIEELRLLQMADLPNVDETQQYVTFFNVAPAGGMSLENRAGGQAWGLERVLQ
jgi:hypothetical protein